MMWDDKLLNGIESMCVKSLACVRVMGGESECFRINSGVRRVYHVPLTLQCIYGRNFEGENLDEKGRERDFRRREESGYYLASCMQMT